MRSKFLCIAFSSTKNQWKRRSCGEPKDDGSLWGNRGKERGAFRELVKALSRMDEQDQKLLLSMAQGMARRGGKR